jgi:hypothetical protein
MSKQKVKAGALFLGVLKTYGIPLPEEEYRFHPKRKWRADYAWPDYKVMLEVEGGVFTGGRHTRGSGFLGDMEKYNEAAAHGWRLIRCTPSGLLKAATLQLIQRALRS